MRTTNSQVERTCPEVVRIANSQQGALLNKIEHMVALLLGTEIVEDVPLMSAGLDSIATVELARELNRGLSSTLPLTLLFDHPSTRSVTNAIKP
ncbi:acyl carrier protein [bacterium]|nr:acyl carrier protein [bacterium]